MGRRGYKKSAKGTSAKSNGTTRQQDKTTLRYAEPTWTKHADRLPKEPRHTATFTLADEARNTSQHDHHVSWTENTRLRSKTVTFVSAGFVEPSKWGKTENTGFQTPTGGSRPTRVHTTEPPGENARLPSTDSTSLSGKEEEKAVRKLKDVTSIPDLGTTKSYSKEYFPCEPNREEQSIETDESDTSEEVILFTGRHKRPISHADDDVGITSARVELLSVNEISPTRLSQVCNDNLSSLGRRRRASKWRESAANEEDAILSDYIANMRDNGYFSDTGTISPHDASEISDSNHIQMLEKTPDTVSTARRLESASDISIVLEKEQLGNGPNRTNVMMYENHGLHYRETSPESMSNSIQQSHSPSNSGEDKHPSIDTSGVARSSLGFDTTALDASTSFDPMDWERPSLKRRKKRKGGGGILALDLGLQSLDSDIEEKLQTAWRNDRLKKSERKKQRQELHQLGLLKHQSRAEVSRAQYPLGMSLQQVEVELKTFLIGTASSISLPPMDKHARKAIHELANKFNVKSKSIGKDDQRRPTLYRTIRTLPFTDDLFNQAVSRVHRRYFPRLDVKAKSSPSKTGSYAATGYRDGDIVGATAPELGIDNRGRTMLEKMGWSRGTALGTADNKGILQPVTQAVKRTKAGLG